MKRIIESAWKETWGKFVTFGTASAGIIGLIMVVRLIKFLVDTIIHGYALFTVYGWSIALIGAIWDSMTGLLLLLAGRRTQKPNKKEKPEPVLEPKLESVILVKEIEQQPPSAPLERPQAFPRETINNQNKQINENLELSERNLYPTLSEASNLYSPNTKGFFQLPKQ